MHSRESEDGLASAAGPTPKWQQLSSPRLSVPSCKMVVISPFPTRDTMRIKWELVEGFYNHQLLHKY